MKSLGKSVLFPLVCSILAACASYPDVRPTDNGVHTVSFLTERKDEGYQKAFGQARDYCEEFVNTTPKVIAEYSEFVGSGSEEEYNRSKTIAKVTEAVGVGAWILGGSEVGKAGTVLFAGGHIADSAIGEGYRYTLKFRCQ